MTFELVSIMYIIIRTIDRNVPLKDITFRGAMKFSQNTNKLIEKVIVYLSTSNYTHFHLFIKQALFYMWYH